VRKLPQIGFLQKSAISGIKKIILSNGLTVFLEELPEKKKVMFIAGIGVGAKNETNETQGISHFVEHIQFHSNRFRAANEITEDSEDGGADIDAGTDFDSTMVWVLGYPRHLSKNARILYEAIKNFEYNEDEIEKEKNEILSELKREIDSPEEYCLHYLFISALLRKTFCDKPVLGSVKTVKRFTREDLISFKKKFYVPANMAIFVCGRFEEECVLKIIQKTFGRFKMRFFKPPEMEIKLVNRRKELFKKRKGLKQAYMILGWRVPAFNHRDSLKLFLLDSILSLGMSSRLYKKLRGEKGIVYGLGSKYDDYAGIGVFYIEAAGFDYRRLKEVKTLILEEIEDLKTNLVSKREFSRAKNLFFSDNDDRLEILKNRAFLLADAYFKNVFFDYRNLKKEMEKISREALRRTAQKYFSDGYTLTALVPENFKK
jgi:predicted Zn-dependent peptidase